MKKLVKTAKQQFEERLDQYGLWSEWESQSSCGRIGRVLENDNIVILVHEDDDDKFSEYFYPPFAELRKDDRFFKECLNDYVCHSDETFVYKMVYWLVYGKTECPLSPLDVYFPANHLMYPESHDFSDLYEEVPDVRVVTAKEQWENDSKDAKLCCNLDNGTIWKVLVEKDRLAFFRSNNEDGFYHRYDLPSMDNLRKDTTFIVEYLSLVQDMHPEDLDSAVTWIKKGVYTMSDCSMMDIYQSSKTQGSYEYKDKEVLTKPIEQLLELTPEQKEAVGMIENGLRMLHRSGGKIICYSDENEFYVVNGTKVHDFDNCCESDEWIEENGFTDISDILIHSDKYKFDFLWNVFWGQDCALIARF